MTTPSRFLTPVVSARYRVDTRVLLPLTRPHSIGSELETMNYIVKTYWWPFAKDHEIEFFLKRKKYTSRESCQSPKMKNQGGWWTRLNLSHFNRSPSIYASFLPTTHVSARSVEYLVKFWTQISFQFRYCVDNSNYFPRKKKKMWTSKLHPWPYPGFIFEDRENAVSKMTASQNYAMLTKQAEQHLAVVPITASSCFRKFVSLLLHHHTEWTILSELPEELDPIMKYLHFKIRLIKYYNRLIKTLEHRVRWILDNLLFLFKKIQRNHCHLSIQNHKYISLKL